MSEFVTFGVKCPTRGMAPTQTIKKGDLPGPVIDIPLELRQAVEGDG